MMFSVNFEFDLDADSARDAVERLVAEFKSGTVFHLAVFPTGADGAEVEMISVSKDGIEKDSAVESSE